MPDADRVCDWIEDFYLSFDFRRPGVDRSLGRDLARLVAGQIQARSSTEFRGADPGKLWDENEPRYRRRKKKAYGWDHPNYRTGQMLSFASLLGEPEVQAHLLTMRYGTGEPPDRTYSPLDNRTPAEKRADESVTDRQKALWAHEPRPGVPDRPFYELDDEIGEAAIEFVGEALADYLTKGS